MQETKEFLLSWVPSAAELDASLTPSRGKASATPLFPEVDFYISLLVLVNLVDNQKGEQAVKCANQIFGKLDTQNRRTLDQISAKCYFYYSRAQEMVGQLASVKFSCTNISFFPQVCSSRQAQNCNTPE